MRNDANFSTEPIQHARLGRHGKVAIEALAAFGDDNAVAGPIPEAAEAQEVVLEGGQFGS